MWEWRTIARSPAVARGSSATADGDEVEGAVEGSLVLGAQREVRRGDRRYEAVVEGLRDVERRMHPVPARADRELVDPEPAGVVEPEDLDRGEAGLEQRAVLRGGVLAHVP